MKEKVQKFGRFLSSMVMPNIGGFIAWGFISALFISTGWLPNEKLAGMVSPMLYYLLPILIAFRGGQLVGGDRGGVVGSIAAIGVISGAPDYPMLMGAMLIGPLGGLSVRTFDRAVDGRVHAGFEMLVNNFSVGILGMLLAIIGYCLIGPFMAAVLIVLTAGIDFLIAHTLLPLAAVFIEPAKILFLNNAINHGIFTPIAAQQTAESGKSIMYMLETNPGPGLGVLLAYWMFSTDKVTKASAPGAIIIHFLGGIHEIYFPYVLMNPVVIIAPIVGNFCAILFYSAFGGGLAGPASPGSVIAFMSMSPGGAGMLITIAGVVIAAVVSFIIASPIVKAAGSRSHKEVCEEDRNINAASADSSAFVYRRQIAASDVKKIAFACDAGMGSSVMGATTLRNKLKAAGVTSIEVVHAAVSDIPDDCQIVITHRELAARAAANAPEAEIIPITSFMNAPEYDELTARFAGKASEAPAALLERRNIVLNCSPVSPEEAITACGRLMVESGIVPEEYIRGMLDREESFSVAIGNHLAIPHGTNEVKPLIKRTGMVVMTYPDGIDWNDDKVKLVVGIAAKGDEHLELLGRIVEAVEDEDSCDALVAGATVDSIYDMFNS